MRDIFRMFKHPAMIKMSAFCTAVFALMLVIFKHGIVLIPEVSEIRTANAAAVFFGIFFGPAGAVGCAIGNLVGDFGGTLTWLSPGGMLANFLAAYMPYRIWQAFDGFYSECGRTPSLASRGLAYRLLLSGLASVVSCSAVLAITFDLSMSYPAINTFNMIFCNNAASTAVGIILFILICKMKRIGNIPYWGKIMREDASQISPSQAKRRLVCYLLSTLLCSAFVLACDIAWHAGIAPTCRMGMAAPLAVFAAYTVISLFI